MTPLDENSCADRRPRISFGSAPHGKRQTSTGTEDTTGFRERGLDVCHQHVAALTEHSVHRAVVEVDLLGVHNSNLDVLEPEVGAETTRHLDHVRREVRRDHPAALADGPGHLESQVTSSARELEHRVTRPRIELPNEPRAHRGDGLSEVLAPALPARSHHLPDFEACLTIFLRLHRRDRRTARAQS